jgi:hypothetical protein
MPPAGGQELPSQVDFGRTLRLTMMKPTRRQLLQTSLGAGLIGADAGVGPPARRDNRTQLAPGQLDRILAEPVLRTELLKTPVKIASLELLRQRPTLLVRLHYHRRRLRAEVQAG